MIANIRKLRSSTKEILSAVNRGNIVYISNRGKTCAKIVSVNSDESKSISLSGLWKDDKKTASVKLFIDKLRAQRHVD